MKIYEIGTGYTPIPAQISAATEIVVEELTKAFIKQNIPVEIVDIAADNRTAHNLPIREVKVPGLFSGTDVQLGIMHKMKRVVYSIALAGELKKILKQSKEKVVFHFHNQYNLFFFLKLISKQLRKKCIIAYTNHSGIWRLPWLEIEHIIHKRYFQEAECMRQADIVFLLNEQTKTNVIQQLGVQEDRLVVIGNGVNTDIYHPFSMAKRIEAKEKWGLQNCRVILQIGSVYENKGQLRMAQYLQPLLKENSDLVFAYAGGIVDEEYHQSLLSFAKTHNLTNQIRYLGMLSPGQQVNALYNAAQVAICASKYEGFSLTILESLASGTPILVAENSPFHLGSGCISYRPDTICELINNGVDYETLSQEARKNAVENYSWVKIAADYMTTFQNKVKDND